MTFLTETFDKLEGVPKSILTENMKTVMANAQTSYYKGFVNERFDHFLKNFSQFYPQTM